MRVFIFPFSFRDHASLRLELVQSSEVARVKQIVASMSSLVDSLYDFALGRLGAATGAHTEISSVVEEVMLECRPMAQAAGVSLAAEGKPALVSCSRGALTSVLSNLVRNALKYVVEADRPEWLVDVRYLPRQGSIRIEVEDNGPGLPEGVDARIFEPFVRLSYGKKGLGLGLATVKRVAQACAGRVGVQRRPQGVVFWVELPLARAV